MDENSPIKARFRGGPWDDRKIVIPKFTSRYVVQELPEEDPSTKHLDLAITIIYHFYDYDYVIETNNMYVYKYVGTYTPKEKDVEADV